MTPEVWRAELREILQWLSDEGYQLRTWFEQGEEISSPEELTAMLDTLQLEREFGREGSWLTGEQQRLGRELLGAVDAFFDTQPKPPDPHVAINEPTWGVVRERAAALLTSLALTH